MDNSQPSDNSRNRLRRCSRGSDRIGQDERRETQKWTCSGKTRLPSRQRESFSNTSDNRWLSNCRHCSRESCKCPSSKKSPSDFTGASPTPSLLAVHIRFAVTSFFHQQFSSPTISTCLHRLNRGLRVG